MRSHKFLFVSTVLFAVVIAVPVVQALPVGAPARTLEIGGFSLAGSIGYMDSEVRDVDVTSKSFIVKGAFGGADGVSPYFRLGFADLEGKLPGRQTAR